MGPCHACTCVKHVCLCSLDACDNDICLQNNCTFISMDEVQWNHGKKNNAWTVCSILYTVINSTLSIAFTFTTTVLNKCSHVTMNISFK